MGAGGRARRAGDGTEGGGLGYNRAGGARGGICSSPAARGDLKQHKANLAASGAPGAGKRPQQGPPRWTAAFGVTFAPTVTVCGVPCP